MIKDKLNLDDRDSTIIEMMSKNPQVSQEEIAKKLKLSQPSVWARIRNLKQKGIINNIIGMDFKKVDLNLAKVEVSTTSTQEVIDEFKDCPYFINALITSGKFNVCLFFTGTDLKNIEGIVNFHLRDNPKVKEVEMNIVISTAKSFVLPVRVKDCKKDVNCKQKCKECIK